MCGLFGLNKYIDLPVFWEVGYHLDKISIVFKSKSFKLKIT